MHPVTITISLRPCMTDIINYLQEIQLITGEGGVITSRNHRVLPQARHARNIAKLGKGG